MEEKEVAQGLFDGGVRKTFCGKKEMYVALMAEPTFSQFSKFMPVSKKDEVSAMRTLIKDCFWMYVRFLTFPSLVRSHKILQLIHLRPRKFR